MEWQLTFAEAAVPVTPEPSSSAGSSDSVTVALITALGIVVVALIGLVAQWINRSVRTGDAPPVAIDPKLGERVAVAERLVHDDRTVLDVIDRRLDRAEDRIEVLEWRLNQNGTPPVNPPRPIL